VLSPSRDKARYWTKGHTAAIGGWLARPTKVVAKARTGRTLERRDSLEPVAVDSGRPPGDDGDMPNRSSKAGKRPTDPNQLAKSIVDEATGQAEPTPPPQKNPAAVELGRRGGLKGGAGGEADARGAERSRPAGGADAVGRSESLTVVGILVVVGEGQAEVVAELRMELIETVHELRQVLAEFHDGRHGRQMLAEANVAVVGR